MGNIICISVMTFIKSYTQSQEIEKWNNLKGYGSKLKQIKGSEQESQG
jgi:hypothetical protein